MPQVDIKHAGKAYKVDLDPSRPVRDLKDQIYQQTGVPADRMKIMIAAKLVKDTDDLAKITLKPGQPITVIGTAGPLPKGPSKPMVFLEDLPEAQLAATRPPLGLQNLGNTCYMNASLQAIRTIPELDPALKEYKAQPGASAADPDAAFTQSLKTLFGTMREKKTAEEAVVPLVPLTTLRRVAPQFQEQDSHGGYSQQDADEMWTQTISSLHHSLRPSGSAKSFVDQYLSADLQQTLTCDEAPEEEPSVKVDRVLKLDCNISIETNQLMSGIKDSFDQKIEKNSPSLGRTAVYTQKSRLSRLPTNLTIHMVRFYWRADIQKKAKIMRRVEFPFELDVFDLLTDDLKAKVTPIRAAVWDNLKAREDRVKLRRRTHKSSRPVVKAPGGDEAAASSGSATPMEVDGVEDEAEVRKREGEKVRELVRAAAGGEPEPGTNWSGLYELSAIVTHKGPSADSGHYIAWTRQEGSDNVVPGEEDWYKFDDDKVSTVKKDKIQALAGGGEDSVAYILLYRAVV
ncbi:hypothetical protein NliqN6_6253 [Naganishia liquefaciens]|uniref:Ubiquitin carboxyl-terminal hydrolase n=1 Tax=Naganishia liquefaciens TaxID=104408 RepID=A0A8H3TYA6_9TREE|nr:hypothetical protein NliqN6_6253 [Naganishia liquefaciens]